MATRETQCGNKHRHETWRSAQLEAASAAKRNRHGAIRVYRCPWCRGFHIGHDAPARRIKALAS
jgi:hypothetical protein